MQNLKIIIGETKCHNQIAINVATRFELLEVIDKLSKYLLEPFPKKPSSSEYEKMVSLELAKVRELNSQGIDVALFLDRTQSSEDFNCLIGPTKIHPDAWILNSLGMARAVAGDLDEALNLFKEALNKSPDYFYALYNAGSCLANMGRFKEALPFYEHAVKINPNDQDTENELDQVRQSMR